MWLSIGQWPGSTLFEPENLFLLSSSSIAFFVYNISWYSQASNMTLLADILAQVTLLRVFVFSFLFLVISFIFDLLSQPRYPGSIPVLGHDSRKWFSTIRNSFAYFTQHQAWTGEGYEKVAPLHIF